MKARRAGSLAGAPRAAHGVHSVLEFAAEADLERLFVEALPDIDAVCRGVARRYRIRDGELADLTSMVKLSIITNRYRVLARFQGRCSFRTYLQTVVLRLFLDHRRKQYGKWRASAGAIRRGPLAVALEKLIHHQGFSREEAIQRMATSRDPGVSRRALDELADGLPPRRPKSTFVSDGIELAGLVSRADGPEDTLRHGQSAALAQRAVEEALQGLAAGDLLILRLRFEDNLTTAEIARLLGLDVRPLYRRMESAIDEVRRRMRRQGVRWADLAHLAWARVQIRWPDPHLGCFNPSPFPGLFPAPRSGPAAVRQAA